MIQKRTDRRIWLALPVLFVAMFLFAFLFHFSNRSAEEASAANLANFRAGYIISDWQMTNYSSMSEAEIQNWLTAKNSCRNTNYGYYLQLSAGSAYRWHFENGHFICLSEERFGNSDDEIGFQYSESAAHIIWQAAQDYQINPKVLLVLLQKETGLITDDIPNNGDYRKATGYGCPDTAACSSQYYGFKNQVRNAAYLFRIVMDGNSSYYPIGNNYIQYNPNAACGSSIVNVQNLATSALYRYTPYQPNAGALAAGYGTAPCGAYGNRNFYQYFEDWFGGITDEGWPSTSMIMSNNRVAAAGSDLSVKYKVHLQHYGWLAQSTDGEMAGSAGYSIRMEAMIVELGDGESGIEYRTHVADYGWLPYVRDGEISGTIGESKQVEAIQVRLTGDLAKRYDVYYRSHVADIGWTEWVKNDTVSGTTGESRQMEAYQIRLVKKDFNNGPLYSVHVKDIGWMDWVKNGELAGTTGQSLRVEAVRVKLSDALAVDGSIQYRVHVKDIGWMDWVKNGELAGTTGQSLRVEAVEIKLVDGLASEYDVYYRTHVKDIGWMKWVKNGELAGTTGQSKRIEALEIELVEK